MSWRQFSEKTNNESPVPHTDGRVGPRTRFRKPVVVSIGDHFDTTASTRRLQLIPIGKMIDQFSIAALPPIVERFGTTRIEPCITWCVSTNELMLPTSGQFEQVGFQFIAKVQSFVPTHSGGIERRSGWWGVIRKVRCMSEMNHEKATG